MLTPLRTLTALLIFAGTIAHAQPTITSFQHPYPLHGGIERYEPEFDELVITNAKFEILAEGFRWSEGPVWDPRKQRLLFSDVPANTAYSWDESSGVSIFLKPSGHSEMTPQGVASAGANGLMFSPQGQLAICQHGNRRIALYNESTNTFATLADRYQDREFYSPNDLAYDTKGTLYFTDPPYGLPHEKRTEIKTHYVYRRATDGTISQIIDSIAYPNGIGLSPDDSILYIGSSDQETPGLYAFELDSYGVPHGESTLLFDAKSHRSEKRKGGCDGMVIDIQGNIWTTGPGGVYVLAPTGKLLGFLDVEARLANLTFGGPDGTTLYITAAQKLLRIETRTSGSLPR